MILIKLIVIKIFVIGIQKWVFVKSKQNVQIFKIKFIAHKFNIIIDNVNGFNLKMNIFVQTHLVDFC